MQANNIIGIRREDITPWERRVALTPQHIERLIQLGLKVIVQPSYRRCFPDALFEQVGATIKEDLSEAALIIGVKAVPINLLLPSKTYLFFSHTIKGQLANMPMLDHILANNIQLLDYECITENGKRGGKRLVAFGSYAGYAGAIDFFSGLGKRLLLQGYSTPFLKLSQSYTYKSLAHAEEALRSIAADIRAFGFPRAISPLTIAVTGNGKVSHGVQHILSLLPHSYVAVPTLAELASSPTPPQNEIVVAICECKDYIIDSHGGFDKQDYYNSPSKYKSVFHERVLPYASVIINGMYWSPAYPRIVENYHLRELFRSDKKKKLLGICDITCDLQGSIEALSRFTTIDNPFYVYNTETEECVDGIGAEGILFMAVDQLPTEFAEDSSFFFGEQLVEYVWELAKKKKDCKSVKEEYDLLPVELRNAVITHGNELTPTWKTIQREREINEKAARMLQRSKHGMTREVRGEERRRDERRREEKREDFDNSVTMVLSGHIFDSKYINRIFDATEKHDEIQLIILDWKVGQDTSQVTKVTLEMLSDSSTAITEFLTKIRYLMLDSIYQDASLNLEIVDYTGDLSFPELDSNSHIEAYNTKETPKQFSSPTSRIKKPIAALTPPRSQLQSPIRSLSRPNSALSRPTMHRSLSHQNLRPASPLVTSTPKHFPLLSSPLLASPHQSHIDKSLLILGAGLVVPPLLDYLTKHASANYHIYLASCIHTEALSLSLQYSHCEALHIDVTNPTHHVLLLETIQKSDLVISMLPATLHPIVAQHCITYQKHFVTASYVSPALEAFDAAAKENNLVFANEVGLDPGIDHLSAMEVFERLRRSGGELLSFRSVCGGLPSPECANNVFNYKFSWAPKGVLLALLNSAKYLKEGKEVDIDGEDLLCSVEDIDIGIPLSLECIPNRDSLKYRAMYGIDDFKELHTVFRGTLRYKGFSILFLVLRRLGFLDNSSLINQHEIFSPQRNATWKEALFFFLQKWREANGLVGARVEDGGLREMVEQVCKERWGSISGEESERVYQHVLNAMNHIHMLDPHNKIHPQQLIKKHGHSQNSLDTVKTPSLGDIGLPPPPSALAQAADDHEKFATMTVMDCFCELLKRHLEYGYGERDMSLLSHEFIYRSHEQEVRKLQSILCVYGDEKFSSMSKCVGYTTAITADLIMNNKIKTYGVVRPFSPEFVRPILNRLEKLHIKFVEIDLPYTQ